MNWSENFDRYPGLPETTPEERARYEKHFQLLKEWNEKFNLVSRKSIESAFSIHFADSLYLADRAARHFGGLPVIDLGSGAGFPGLVLAARYPSVSVTLLERSEKKRGFLQEVVSEVGLKNVQVAETFHPHAWTKAFLISRAVMAPAEIFEYVGAHLQPGSRVAITVGGMNQYPEAAKGYKLLENTEYTLPEDRGSRKISVFDVVPRGT